MSLINFSLPSLSQSYLLNNFYLNCFLSLKINFIKSQFYHFYLLHQVYKIRKKKSSTFYVRVAHIIENAFADESLWSKAKIEKFSLEKKL